MSGAAAFKPFWCDFCEDYHESLICPHPAGDLGIDLEGLEWELEQSEANVELFAGTIHEIRAELMALKEGEITDLQALENIQRWMAGHMPTEPEANPCPK